ncbi:unnamed protein product [Enterobius vermicularis]|uniref:C-type lectin domain-containing protein n=1 Tax=Enterobius vermicularis TaxID=51028 RepID=A0A0N4V7U1_ENTVE|nr:unnamed protein product [Enterobius vermicularis]
MTEFGLAEAELYCVRKFNGHLLYIQDAAEEKFINDILLEVRNANSTDDGYVVNIFMIDNHTDINYVRRLSEKVENNTCFRLKPESRPYNDGYISASTKCRMNSFLCKAPVELNAIKTLELGTGEDSARPETVNFNTFITTMYHWM